MAARRPPGLKTQAVRDEFDRLVADLKIADDDTKRRRSAARAALLRQRADNLLDEGRQTAAELMYRRADAAVKEMRLLAKNAPPPTSENDTPRLKWMHVMFDPAHASCAPYWGSGECHAQCSRPDPLADDYDATAGKCVAINALYDALAADEDAATYQALLDAHGHYNMFTRAERAWAHGETTDRPHVPTAA